MTRDDIERLVSVELQIAALGDSLREHRAEAKDDKRELREMIAQLGVKIDESKFKWSYLFSKENVKAILYIALTLTGAAGAAKALLE